PATTLLISVSSRSAPLSPLFPYTTLFRSFWHNVRDTVVFHQAMERMIDAGVVDYVELGAHPALARSVLECLGTRRGSSLPSLRRDRKSTRLNSSHVRISYAVC